PRALRRHLPLPRVGAAGPIRAAVHGDLGAATRPAAPLSAEPDAQPGALFALADRRRPGGVRRRTGGPAPGRAWPPDVPPGRVQRAAPSPRGPTACPRPRCEAAGD